MGCHFLYDCNLPTHVAHVPPPWDHLTLHMLPTLPPQCFVWVHLIGVADAARASLTSVCASPAFAGTVAQRHYGMLTRAVRLVALLSPLPSTRGVSGGCGRGARGCPIADAWHAGSLLAHQLLTALSGGLRDRLGAGPCPSRPLPSFIKPGQ